MARKTISQRIALLGSEEIRQELAALGTHGEAAFRDIQAAADKLKGPGAQFARNMDRARKRIRALGEQFSRVGARIRNLGAGLAASVSAPVLGIATMMTNAASTMDELQRLAELSNTTFDEFQRLAHGAQTVGIEHDKLGDIFKDVQDKVGDFISTGGGPMADFFEKIAPQVGLTAEQFRKLSGPDALLAYTSALEKAGVSQSEMVFYMEALASDASLLLPLLRDNGKEFERLGKAAHIVTDEEAENLRAYTRSLIEFRAAVRALVAALATSGVAEMLTGMVERATQLINVLSDTNPMLIKWGAVIAGIVAVFAPLLAMLGFAVQGIGTLGLAISGTMGLLGQFSGVVIGLSGGWAAVAGAMRVVLALVASFLTWPVLLGAAIAALAAAVIWHWDEIVAATASAWSAVEGAGRSAIAGIRDFFGSAFNWIRDRARGVLDWLAARLQSIRDAISSALSAASSAVGFARGGRVRGPGTTTSDSIPAWLSRDEFVIKASAVKHYGAQVFAQLNAMQLPRFAEGGLVRALPPMVPASAPAFAAGGQVALASAGGTDSSGPYATVNLSLGRESFNGLMAPREVADRLMRFALSEEVKSAGRRPAWFAGGSS